MKKLIYILGAIILCVTSSLVTFFTLSSMNIIDLKEKIELEVAIENIAKEYDGTALSANNYTFNGDLQEGHVLDVEYSGSQLEVGTTSSTAHVRVLELSTGKDVSELYELSVKPGLIQILPREITILFDSNKEYSGPTIDQLDYQITNGSLVVGDEMVVQYTGEVSQIGPLPVSNELLNILLYNSAGHNVTNNYHITYQVKNFNIIKRDLVIKPYPLQKVYDGQKLNVDSYEIISGSLLEGHRIEKVEYDLKTHHAGSYNDQTIEVQIVDVSGNDVTSYYSINPNLTFKLDILQQKVELELPKLKFASKTEAIHGYNDVLFDLSNIDGIYFSLKSDFVLAEDRLVQEITANDIIIDGTESYNYDFTFLNGQIEIYQEIELPHITFTYNGSNMNELYNNKIPNVDDLSIRLIEDHQYVDVGTYEITEKELVIEGNSDGVHFIKGSITILPEEVSFGSNCIQHPYNGSYFEIQDNELKLYQAGTVLEDYFIKNVVLDSYEVTEERLLKSFTAKILDYKIFNNEGKNVTSNFNISSNSIFCQFLKCDLNLKMKDIRGIYFETKNYPFSDLISDDYKNHIPQGDYIQNGSLSIQFVETTTLVDIQTKLKEQIQILNMTGKDVTFAYNVDVLEDHAQFYIEKRPAKIILPSYQNDYDGKTHTFTEITTGKIQMIGFVNNEEPIIESSQEWKDAGTYSYTCSYDEKLNSKYDITIVSGTVSITKRKAQIVLPNHEKEYDGTAFTFANIDNNEIEYIGFVNNERPALNCDKQWKDAGTYSYIGTWDTNYDRNYDITMVPGIITITRKRAQIVLPNHEKIYDGTVLAFTDIPVEKITYTGFLKEDVPTINCADKWQTVGTYSYTCSYDEKLNTKYDISIVTGTITITRKKAQITLPNYEKEYDGTDFTFANIPANKTTYTGFLKDDIPTIVCTDKWQAVGTYSYIGTWGTDFDARYDITIVPGTITISRKKAQITLPNCEKTYDGAALTFANIPANEITYTGFLKDDGPSSTDLTCTDQWLEAGTYSYTCQWSTDYNKNYEITVIPGVITINKVTFSIASTTTLTHVYNGSYYKVFDDELSFTAQGQKYYLRNVSIASTAKINYLSTMAVKFNTTGYSIYNSNGEEVTKNFNTTNFELSLRYKAKTVNFYISDFNVGTYGDNITISPVTLLKGFESNLFESEYLEISESEFMMDWTTCTIMDLYDLSNCISITAQFAGLEQDVIVDGVYDITIVNAETFKPTFNKRKAQIVFGDVELIYTGTPFTYDDIASSTYCRGFLTEDVPTFTCTDTWTDVGTYQYYCTWDETLDLYYDISVTVGTIKITN